MYFFVYLVGRVFLLDGRDVGGENNEIMSKIVEGKCIMSKIAKTEHHYFLHKIN